MNLTWRGLTAVAAVVAFAALLALVAQGNAGVRAVLAMVALGVFVISRARWGARHEYPGMKSRLELSRLRRALKPRGRPEDKP